MGIEKKFRKRRSSPSSSSEDDNGRSRKNSKRDDEKERKTRKDEDKERKRKRDHKSHDHSGSREARDKKTKGKHKHGKKLSDPGFKELTVEDYFSRNNEFSTWLKEEKGVYFSDLSSESARDLFSRFIKAWNRQKLQPQYYDGIASAQRTSHNWKIKH